MKKKILAAALALCLVLGLLPLSAMAKTWNLSGANKTFTLTKNANGEYSASDNDLNEYYAFTGVKVENGDTKLYYTMKKAVGDCAQGTTGSFTVTITSETYDITFNLNYDGAPAAEVKETSADNKVTPPDNPTRTSTATTEYTFKGWSESNDNDVSKVIDLTNKTFTSDTTLYAVWAESAIEPEKTTYTITLDLNYEGAPEAKAFTTDPETGYLTTVTDAFSSPTREGYGFKGWAKDQKATAATIAPEALKTTAFTEADDGTTLYAVWEKAKAVKVTFDANGGSVSKTSDTTGENGLLTSLPTPTYSGRVFLGWFTAKTGGTKVTEEYVFTAETTIYAQWGFKITFDANGGTLTGDATANTGADGKLAALPTDPTHASGKFYGWNTKADGTGDAVTTDTVFEKATTVYATWSFTVTFYLNDGTDEVCATILTLGNGKVAEMPDDPEREGYDFDGWFTAKENDAGEPVNGGTVFTKNTPVYAHWTAVVDVAGETTVEGGKAETTFPKADTEEAQKEVTDKVKGDIENSKPEKVKLTVEKEDAKTNPATVTNETIKVTAGYFKAVVAAAKDAHDKDSKVASTIEIKGITGSVDLPITDAVKMDGDVVFEVKPTDKKAADYKAAAEKAAGNIKNKGMKARKAVENSLKTVDVSLTVDGKDFLKAGGSKVAVSAYIAMDRAPKLANLAMLYLEDMSSYTVTGYLNGVISWLTDHLSPWGAIELMDEEKAGGGGGGAGGGGGGSASSGYSVSVSKTTNGKVSTSPSKAEEGDTVTITVTPDKGYELDKLTVKDADGNTIKTTKTSDGKYTFTMPDGKVTIEATFKAIEEKETTTPAPTTPSFSDVPSSFWAYQQISWVAEKGIMGGYANGTFGANNNTTRQALWMVLGRLSGELDSKSTMAQAREWAIKNNISDGTNAEGAMSRQQMVTMLYRYAQMKGYATTGSTALSTYPDAAGVASYAQDALSWAVANGVVTGTTDGRLNPEGTASRAHFAVFMYRFCGLYDNVA